MRRRFRAGAGHPAGGATGRCALFLRSCLRNGTGVRRSRSSASVARCCRLPDARHAMTPFNINDLPSRVRAKVRVDETAGCWLWLGALTHGYGSLGIENRTYRAHRFVWAYFNGPIPPDRELHHQCYVRCCVNPGHLESVTKLEHPGSIAAIHAAKTCCPTCGGAYHLNSKGKRSCRACMRRAESKYYHRKQRGPHTLLNAQQIPEIRRLSRLGLGPTAIGQRFGVKGTTIGSVLSGRSWAHVPDGASHE